MDFRKITSGIIPFLLRFTPKRHQLRAAILIVLGCMALFYCWQLFGIYTTIQTVKSDSSETVFLLKERQWDLANKQLADIQDNVLHIKTRVRRLYPFTLIPALANETRIAETIAIAGANTIEASRMIVVWLSTLPLLQEDADVGLDSFTIAQKKELLQAVADAEPLWAAVHAKTQSAAVQLASIQGKSRIPAFANKINAAIDQFIGAQQIFSDVQPFLSILPSVAGYPTQKTYLLLLQNNTELRPTGGFIGTYGIVRVLNGEVASLTTENVYNLDEPYKSKNTKAPPLPLQRYIKQSQWFFRDVNWDPDFPTTAQNAIRFYIDEGGVPRAIDGVVALTPTVVERLLQLVGPIQIDGNNFTAENLVDILAYHVEKGFVAEGITAQNRKLIIDQIAQELKSRLLALSVKQVGAAFTVLLSSLDDRQLQIYFTNTDIQKIVESYNWGGSIRETTGDYVMVIDANLGSLKSDPAVERSLAYEVVPQQDGAMRAQLSITYTHTKDFDWKTTRYRTYTRVYVPQGATLLFAKGNEEQISITNEHGKTVFGTFISIEPLKSETLTFAYTLPQSVFNQADYSLLIQKQAGTMPHAFSVTIDLPFAIGQINSAVPVAQSSHTMTSTFNLGTDMFFSAIKKQ